MVLTFISGSLLVGFGFGLIFDEAEAGMMIAGGIALVMVAGLRYLNGPTKQTLTHR